MQGFRVLLLAAAIALAGAAPALGDCTSQAGDSFPQWQCDKCNLLPDTDNALVTPVAPPTPAPPQISVRQWCFNLAKKGYNLDVIMSCGQQTNALDRDACLSYCLPMNTVGNEWRCSKCLVPSINRKNVCFNNEPNLKLDSEAFRVCLSAPFTPGSERTQLGFSCLLCYVSVADRIGPGNDWRCSKCNVPEVREAGDDATALCYSLIAGRATDGQGAERWPPLAQVDDLVTCSKIPDKTLRTKCFFCLLNRTKSNAGTWPCVACARKAAGAADTCLNCLGDPSKTWECTS